MTCGHISFFLVVTAGSVSAWVAAHGLPKRSEREQFFLDQEEMEAAARWRREQGRPDPHRFFGMMVRK